LSFHTAKLRKKNETEKLLALLFFNLKKRDKVFFAVDFCARRIVISLVL